MPNGNQNRNNNGKGNQNNKSQNSFSMIMMVVIILAITLAMQLLLANQATSGAQEISYGEFRQLIKEDKVDYVVMESDKYTIYLKEGESYTPDALDEGDTNLDELQEIWGNENSPFAGSTNNSITVLYCAPINDAGLIDLLEEHGIVEYGPEYVSSMSPILSTILQLLVTFGSLLLVVWLFSRMMSKSMGSGGIGGIGGVKSNAKVYMEKETGVTFADVAGQDEAKESLQEIIDFLHNPKKYTEIGAKLPKGALLVGSPGTGKTLLAKAVAGEANVPFFSISGSDFVELYAGVGASRVRDLFKEAAKVAPCIIFIDEIDTIGRSRDNKFGGDSEREQTLNQLLAELDGFDPTKGVIVLAATNRPEVLDKALLRPGRFDRRITVDRPDLAGRLATLKVHTRGIRLDGDVDLKRIAQATAGCVGADLANLVNEAALRAVRFGRKTVNQEDLLASFEMVIAGAERKTTVLTESEKKLVSYHEVGHALVAAKQKNAQPVQKITIVPHTQGALGYTLQLPEEEKFLLTREEIMTEIRTLLGGRAAEELIFNTQTSGASNDLERATEAARRYVAMYGMSEEIGTVGFAQVSNPYLDGGVGLNCAQETAAVIDKAIMALLSKCAVEAKQILEDNKQHLENIAQYLLEKETITGEEMMAIIRGENPGETSSLLLS